MSRGSRDGRLPIVNVRRLRVVDMLRGASLAIG
jgi:hypothetical protein